MTKKKFSAAFSIARSDRSLCDTPSVFYGCGLPGFQPVACTLEQIASFIRYQALQMNGEFDNSALTEIMVIGKRRFKHLAHCNFLESTVLYSYLEKLEIPIFGDFWPNRLNSYKICETQAHDCTAYFVVSTRSSFAKRLL